MPNGGLTYLPWISGSDGLLPSSADGHNDVRTGNGSGGHLLVMFQAQMESPFTLIVIPGP